MFMKKAFLISAIAASLTMAAPAFAADAPMTSAATDIGTLVDNPATRAILDKVLPGMTTNPQLEMARSMTLKQVQSFAPEQITDERLALIDAELAKLPPAK
jgi:hypothetical protein